jgi:hypothetical protein
MLKNIDFSVPEFTVNNQSILLYAAKDLVLETLAKYNFLLPCEAFRYSFFTGSKFTVKSIAKRHFHN